MHHDLLQLDQQVPAQRELQAGRLNDSRCASREAAARAARALTQGEASFTEVPLDREGASQSLTIVRRFYSGSGVLIVAVDHCQN